MIEFEIADVRFSEELVQFWRESFLAAYVDIHTKENIEAYFDESYTLEEANNVLSSEIHFCLKALRDQETVGVAIVAHQKCPLLENLIASELKQLYLLPSEYGSGLAYQMMEEVFRRIKGEEKEYVWLNVSKKNPRAQKFYQKIDFEMVGGGDDIHVGSEVLPSQIMIRRI
ncbi:GNAT family N-acetyltransferase [Ekhidna sp.]